MSPTRDSEGFFLPLVVEVRHHVPHPHALLPDEILDGDFHIIELDERRPRAEIPTHLQSPHAHSRVPLQRDLQHAQPAGPRPTSPYRHGRIVAPDAVRDPLLRAVDEVEPLVRSLRRSRANVRNIGPSAGLRDRDASPLAPRQEVRQEARLEVRGAEFDQGRHAEGHADGDAAAGARDSGAVDLVDVDGRVDVVPLGDGDGEDGGDADGGEGGHGEGGR